MNTLFYIFSAIIGLVIGSFLNALVFRLYHGYSMWGFSLCPHCRHRLTAWDLVPLLSFVFLRGKCRYCHKKISWQYPLVEMVTALVFLLVALRWGSPENNPEALGLIAWQWIFAALLIGIFVFDCLYYLIPDILIAIGGCLALFYRFSSPSESVAQGLWGVLVVAGFFGILYLFSQGKWIGLGDVKLGIFLGLLLGWQMSLVMLMLAYISGALVGVALILSHRKTLHGILPFGTFLSIATVAVMLWGDSILNWYLMNFSLY